MTPHGSVLRILGWRLGGVAVGALGVGLMVLAAWHYTRGPQYGAGGSVFLVGVGLAWGGLQMIKRARAHAAPSDGASGSSAAGAP